MLPAKRCTPGQATRIGDGDVAASSPPALRAGAAPAGGKPPLVCKAKGENSAESADIAWPERYPVAAIRGVANTPTPNFDVDIRVCLPEARLLKT
jgi:hypothetical protein